VAILLYGFPPGVGATGTAALLNVPRSLEKTLAALRQQGYSVGTDGAIDGEAIVAALQAQVLTDCQACLWCCPELYLVETGSVHQPPVLLLVTGAAEGGVSGRQGHQRAGGWRCCGSGR
jgi:CobN/Magnesium Chelatase